MEAEVRHSFGEIQVRLFDAKGRLYSAIVTPKPVGNAAVDVIVSGDDKASFDDGARSGRRADSRASLSPSIASDPPLFRLADLAVPLCGLIERLARAQADPVATGPPSTAPHLPSSASLPMAAVVSCREGCSACCRQLVTLSLPEAFAIFDFLEALPSREFDDIARRMTEAARCLGASGSLLGRMENLVDPNLDHAAHHALARDYHRLWLPCPFLRDNRCRIYPVRPALCREYFVVSPSELCENPFESPVEAVPTPLSARDVLAGLVSDLTRGEPCLLALPLLFDRMRSDGWTRLRRRYWTIRRMTNTLTGHLEAMATITDRADAPKG